MDTTEYYMRSRQGVRTSPLTFVPHIYRAIVTLKTVFELDITEE